MNVLAIDQGTTSTRAVLLSRDGRARVVFSRVHRQIRSAPGLVEHDPEELLDAIRAGLEAGAATGPLAAVALANQGESCLAWDAETGRAAGPLIVWQDDRTLQDVERLMAQGAEALTLSRAGLPLDPYFSGSKLGWLLREVPEAAALHRCGRLRLGTTDAFFRDRLTGRFETDPTTASRTSLMDLGSCTWDEDLCALFGVPRDALPAIVPTTGDLGHLTAGGRRVPLLASLVDQQAAVYGHGCRDAGDAKVTFGTGAFVLAVAPAGPPRVPAGCLPTIAWAKKDENPRFALDGGVFAAGAAVNWARDLGLARDLAEFDALDGPTVVGTGLCFVPALSGLGAPHWDRRARGAWMGLGLAQGRSDLLKALLEGIAYRTAEVVEAMGAGSLSVDGGLSANTWFVQVLADALGRTVQVSQEPELTGRGAALLAAEVAGLVHPSGPGGRHVSPRSALSWRPAFVAAREAVQAYAAR